MRTSKTFLRKFSLHLALICFGTISALLVLEAGMRVAKWSVTAKRAAQASPDSFIATLRILCVGESTTEGFGSLTWPAQLEAKLRLSFPSLQVKVFNQGISGVDTKVLAANLPSWLDRFAPHIVIMMAGVNDNQHALMLDPKTADSIFYRTLTGRFLTLLKASQETAAPRKQGGASEDLPLLSELREKYWRALVENRPIEIARLLNNIVVSTNSFLDVRRYLEALMKLPAPLTESDINRVLELELISRNDAIAMQNIVTLLMRSNREQRARDILHDIDLNGYHSDIILRQVSLLDQLDMRQESEDLLRTSIMRAAAPGFYLALAARKSAQPDEERSIIQDGAQRFPEDRALSVRLLDILKVSNQAHARRELLNTWLNTRSQDDTLVHHLARQAFDDGDSELALRWTSLMSNMFEGNPEKCDAQRSVREILITSFLAQNSDISRDRATSAFGLSQFAEMEKPLASKDSECHLRRREENVGKRSLSLLEKLALRSIAAAQKDEKGEWELLKQIIPEWPAPLLALVAADRSLWASVQLPRDGILMLNTALEQYPNQRELRLKRALMNSQIDQSAALADFAKLATAWPNWGQATRDYSRLLKATGRNAESQEVLQSSMRVAPNEDVATELLQRALREPDKSRAIEIGRQLLLQFPWSDKLLQELGEALEAQQQFRESRELILRRMRYHDRDNLEVFFYGRAALAEGDFDLALRWYEGWAPELLPPDLCSSCSNRQRAVSAMLKNRDPKQIEKLPANLRDSLLPNDHYDFFYLEQTQKTLRKLASLAKSRGATVIAMQYPMLPLTRLEEALDGIDGVIFVGNRVNFQNALSEKGFSAVFTDRFAQAFGHMTDFGNSLIVENLIDPIARLIESVEFSAANPDLGTQDTRDS